MARAKKICKWCGHSISFDKDKYIKQGYEKGRADAIYLITELKNKYEHFTHEEYYVSAMVSDLEDLIEQLKEHKND